MLTLFNVICFLILLLGIFVFVCGFIVLLRRKEVLIRDDYWDNWQRADSLYVLFYMIFHPHGHRSIKRWESLVLGLAYLLLGGLFIYLALYINRGGV